MCTIGLLDYLHNIGLPSHLDVHEIRAEIPMLQTAWLQFLSLILRVPWAANIAFHDHMSKQA